MMMILVFPADKSYFCLTKIRVSPFVIHLIPCPALWAPKTSQKSYNNPLPLFLAHPTAVQTTRDAQLPGGIDAEHVVERAFPVLVQHAVDPVTAAVLRHGKPLQLGLWAPAAARLWHGKTDFLWWFWRRKSDTTGRVHWKPIESK